MTFEEFAEKFSEGAYAKLKKSPFWDGQKFLKTDMVVFMKYDAEMSDNVFDIILKIEKFWQYNYRFNNKLFPALLNHEIEKHYHFNDNDKIDDFFNILTEKEASKYYNKYSPEEFFRRLDVFDYLKDHLYYVNEKICLESPSGDMVKLKSRVDLKIV